jgi:hypothetical protein
MSRVASIVAVAAGVVVVDGLSVTSRVGVVRTDALVDANMRPDAVAHSLMVVEDEWISQAAAYVDCTGKATLKQADDSSDACFPAAEAFKKSCAMVVDAMFQGSRGDKDAVNEYLELVCGQSFLAARHRARCEKLAGAMNALMVEDSFWNRVDEQDLKICKDTWADIVGDEKQRALTEQKAAEVAGRLRAASAKAEADENAKEKALADENAKEKAVADENAKEKALQEQVKPGATVVDARARVEKEATTRAKAAVKASAEAKAKRRAAPNSTEHAANLSARANGRATADSIVRAANATTRSK